MEGNIAKKMKIDIIFPVLNEENRLKNGVQQTVEYLEKSNEEIYIIIDDEFNKYADSLLFICLFVTSALILLLYVIITVAVVLLNRRLLFDRLSGTGYKSTVLNE